MNTTDEFIKAMQSIEPLPAMIIEYRLHYDPSGKIIMCSLSDHPDHDDYLVVNKETYDNYFRYRVHKGVLELVDTSPGLRVQLKSSTQGHAVVKNHAGILLENEDCDDIEYYEDN